MGFWIFLGVLAAVIVAMAVLLKRRDSSGGRPGDAPYGADTVAAQAARQVDRGGMGG